MKLLHETDYLKVEVTDGGTVLITNKKAEENNDTVHAKIFAHMDTLCISTSGDMMISDWQGTTGVQCMPHQR